MGVCSSLDAEGREAAKRTQEFEKIMAAEHRAETMKIKLLLLGAGESGKSTIFKQMKLIYGEGFDLATRMGMRTVIYSNVIQGTKVLIEAAAKLEMPLGAVEELGAAFLKDVDDKDKIDDALAATIGELWADPNIQDIFDKRAEFQLFDSYNKFARDIERIGDEDYEPTVNDVLRSRVRTSGIVEERYVIDNGQFVMYDVGGQRNERKKWIHCFENVTAVIFVAAISEYDQVLYEDHTQNRMVEALNLFDEICNLQWFTNTSMILFLNKRDLYEAKIASVDIRDKATNRFLDYEGGCDGEAGKEYFTRKFKECNKSDEKKVFHHVTCATDTDNVDVVFHSCTEIILKENLGNAGLV